MIVKGAAYLHGWAVVQVEGDLVGSAAAREQVRWERLVDTGCRRLMVDLGRVRSCDAAGYDALVATRRRMAEAGGEVRLVLPASGSAARSALLARGVARLLPAFGSVAEAAALPTE